MTRVNGNDGNFLWSNLKFHTTDRTEKTSSKTDINKTGEVKQTFDFADGSKSVADIRRGVEVEGNVKLNPQDASEVGQLYSMAGINKPVPSQREYDRIGASVSVVTAGMDAVEAESHAEDLFASSGFKVLDSFFG